MEFLELLSLLVGMFDPNPDKMYGESLLPWLMVSDSNSKYKAPLNFKS